MQSLFQIYDTVIMISESGWWEQAYAKTGISGGSGRGGARDSRSPTSGSNFFHFHAFFGKKLAK